MSKFGKRRMGRVVVLGGARSGKSAFAENLARQAGTVDYIVTPPANAADIDWRSRVDARLRRYPPEWTVTETSDLAAVFSGQGLPAVIGSLSTWLASVLDDTGAWIEAPGWRDSLDKIVGRTLQAWRDSERPLLVVSDEVGGGLLPDSVSGRLYRDALGLLNQQFAATADTVWLVTAGIGQRLK